MIWTDERVELVKKRWTDGLSASDIAAELGEGITRSAVLGKVHRLQLPIRNNPHQPRPRASHVRRRSATRIAYIQGQIGKPRLPAIVKPQPVAPEFKSIGIVDVADDQCKFSVSNDGANHLFCAAETELGKPYCPYHCGIVYIRTNRPLPEQEKAAREYRRRHFQLVLNEQAQAGTETAAPPLAPEEMVA